MTITHTVNVTLFPQAPYNFCEGPQRGRPCWARCRWWSSCRVDLPVKSLAELTALGRTRPLNGGSSGNGTPQHLALELYRQLAGINVQHMPFKGGGPSMISLIGGEIDFLITGVPECLLHIKSGKLRALAVAGAARLPAHPGSADHRRTRHAEPRHHQLDRAHGAGRHAEGHHRAHQCRSRARAEAAGHRGARARAGLRHRRRTRRRSAQSFMAAEVARWGKLVRDANIKAD